MPYKNTLKHAGERTVRAPKEMLRKINCLLYLTLDDFSPESTEGPNLSNRNHTSPLTQSQWKDRQEFFSYVASYWDEYVNGYLEMKLESLILRLFERKVHLLYGL